ncbi:MAG TPA: hypothetical protein VHX14_07030 [Thermoanaerobaculia bacterium]|jgi:hypothetical protein|nr:hypothetical protein [Thermoanaerobaculia bacterium]
MFELIRFALEKITSGISWAIDHRRVGKDREVGAALLGLFERMQDVYVVGLRIVDELESYTNDELPPDANNIGNERLADLLREQFENVAGLVDAIERSRRVISTFDADLFAEIAPLLDRKSGLLMRLLQEGRLSQRSSTFIFYLDHATIENLASTGISQAFRRQLSVEVNNLRRDEVRDITRPTAIDRDRLDALMRDRPIRKEIEHIRDIARQFHDRLAVAFDLKAIRQHS